MWNGFYFKKINFRQDLQDWLDFFSPAAIHPWAEGRFILIILLILSDKFWLDSILFYFFLDRIYRIRWIIFRLRRGTVWAFGRWWLEVGGNRSASGCLISEVRTLISSFHRPLSFVNPLSAPRKGWFVGCWIYRRAAKCAEKIRSWEDYKILLTSDLRPPSPIFLHPSPLVPRPFIHLLSAAGRFVLTILRASA